MVYADMKNKPIIYENKDFQTIQIKVLFPFNRKVDELALVDMLPAMLHNLDRKYPTEELFSKECKKLYILSAFCMKSIFGDFGYYEFNLTIPDVKSLGKDMLEEQIKFFSDMIYDPYIVDNSFLEFEVERERKNYKKDIELALKNVSSYHNIKLKEIVDDDEKLYSLSIFNNTDLIDKVTSKELYNFYLDKIKNNQPSIFIMGNVNKKRINELCNKYLFLKKFSNKKLPINLYHYLSPREKINEVIEESNFKNSTISYVYKVKDMCIDDEILLNVCRDLLSSMSSRLLNKKLRDDHDLVYSSFATTAQKYGLFIITASINKINVDLVKEKIVEVVNDLRNEELITPLLDNIKDRFRVGLIRRLDNKGSLFHEFIITNLGVDISEDEYYNKLLKVKPSDITNFIDRLVLDTIYYLKEEESNEKA